MLNILETIYEKFIDIIKDLEIGHVLEEKDYCELWEMIQAYELLDGDIINLKERNQILEFYDEIK